MDEDAFQAHRRFLGEFGVEEEGAGGGVTTAQIGFHRAKEETEFGMVALILNFFGVLYGVQIPVPIHPMIQFWIVKGRCGRQNLGGGEGGKLG